MTTLVGQDPMTTSHTSHDNLPGVTTSMWGGLLYKIFMLRGQPYKSKNKGCTSRGRREGGRRCPAPEVKGRRPQGPAAAGGTNGF